MTTEQDGIAQNRRRQLEKIESQVRDTGSVELVLALDRLADIDDEMAIKKQLGEIVVRLRKKAQEGNK